MFILCIIIPFGGLQWYMESHDYALEDIFIPEIAVMHIGEIPIRIDIADSHEERVQGLSGKTDMGRVDGLLFVFDEAGYHALWMKDMKFAIDMIWVGEDLHVVSIDKNVTPNTYPQSFRPSQPAMFVIETNTHYIDTYGIEVGDAVRLPYRYLDN